MTMHCSATADRTNTVAPRDSRSLGDALGARQPSDVGAEQTAPLRSYPRRRIIGYVALIESAV